MNELNELLKKVIEDVFEEKKSIRTHPLYAIEQHNKFVLTAPLDELIEKETYNYRMMRVFEGPDNAFFQTWIRSGMLRLKDEGGMEHPMIAKSSLRLYVRNDVLDMIDDEIMPAFWEDEKYDLLYDMILLKRNNYMWTRLAPYIARLY